MNLALNKLILSSLAAIVFFLVVINMFEVETLIYIMNSTFAGAMVALLVAYWRIVWNALAGVRPYDRVRQMTLGFVLCWVAYCISVFTSIYFRSADLSGANTASLRTVFGIIVFFAQSESVLKPLVNAMHPINLALLAIAS